MTGLAAVSLAAGAGLQQADALLTALLGDVGAEVRDALRSSLAQRAVEQVAREGVALSALLEVPDLADDAASRLRLRLAVLKGFT